MRLMEFGSGWRAFVSSGGLLLLLLSMPGCGPGRSKVSGRVLYNGTPLPGGRVMFRPADPKQNSVHAELDEQGHYEAVLPVGEVKVSVDNRELEPGGPGGGAPLELPPAALQALRKVKAEPSAPKAGGNAPEKTSGKYVPIPDRYYDSETSGLQFKVERGDQKHDIQLTN